MNYSQNTSAGPESVSIAVQKEQLHLIKTRRKLDQPINERSILIEQIKFSLGLNIVGGIRYGMI